MTSRCNIEKKVMIVGATPQTGGMGGVTIHVERFLQYLEKVNFRCEFFNYKTAPFFDVIGKIKKSLLVHIHVCNPFYMFFLAVACRLCHKKLVMTLHGKYVEREVRYWWLIKKSVKMATVPIVLNQTSYESCRKINPKTTLIPAFIPPQAEELLSDDIINVVSSIHQRGRLAVVTYGYDVIYDVEKREIYGIDFLISFFKDNQTYDLIVSDPTSNYKKKHTENYSNIHFVNQPHSLYELMKIADVFIRNTSKDGDALSVKEALYLKKTVLCSDVVERPKGVFLFHYSDRMSLKSCLDSNLKHDVPTPESGERQIVELYAKLQEGVS